MQKLPVEKLRKECSPDFLHCESTKEISPLREGRRRYHPFHPRLHGRTDRETLRDAPAMTPAPQNFWEALFLAPTDSARSIGPEMRLLRKATVLPIFWTLAVLAPDLISRELPPTGSMT